MSRVRSLALFALATAWLLVGTLGSAGCAIDPVPTPAGESTGGVDDRTKDTQAAADQWSPYADAAVSGAGCWCKDRDGNDFACEGADPDACNCEPGTLVCDDADVVCDGLEGEGEGEIVPDSELTEPGADAEVTEPDPVDK